MRRRIGTLTTDVFELVAHALPALADGEVSVRTCFLSLDPYLARAMKTWVGEAPGWADGLVHGRMIAEVEASRSARFAPGDLVTGLGTWSDRQNLDETALTRVPPELDRPSLVLGVLGRSGLTAWVGVQLASITAGETFVVSAAAGAVGSVAGQLAAARGCRVIGMAGGPEKARYMKEELGFHAALDHRLPDLGGRLAAAAPNGVDVLFENVGAPSLDAALPSLKPGGRVMLCGLAAHYNDEDPLTLQNFKALLYKGLTVRGFITAGHSELFPSAMAELTAAVRTGALVWRETITDGLEAAPAAYLAMLAGQGIGKRLIRLG